MNERIKELAEQACEEVRFNIDPNTLKQIDNPDGSHTRLDFNKQKFAELIILECEKRLRKEGNLAKIQAFTGSIYKFSYMNEAANIIKEHFGVEESQGWVCPNCGTDRTKAVCPKGHAAALTGDCPMYGVAL